MNLSSANKPKNLWSGVLELCGMFLILVSFYYQSFYEGDALIARYDNIRFKLELIENEIIHNSELPEIKSEYNLGHIWKGFNTNRHNVNELSEEHITTIDEINAFISSVRAWVFIVGSLCLIASKYLQYFWYPVLAKVKSSVESVD